MWLGMSGASTRKAPDQSVCPGAGLWPVTRVRRSVRGQPTDVSASGLGCMTRDRANGEIQEQSVVTGRVHRRQMGRAEANTIPDVMP